MARGIVYSKTPKKQLEPSKDPEIRPPPARRAYQFFEIQGFTWMFSGFIGSSKAGGFAAHYSTEPQNGGGAPWPSRSSPPGR
jgi:hypothetical protein